MNYTEKYKEGFYKRIEKELNQCEIIYNPNTKGIWFVNRERKYWFLEYKVERTAPKRDVVVKTEDKTLAIKGKFIDKAGRKSVKVNTKKPTVRTVEKEVTKKEASRRTASSNRLRYGASKAEASRGRTAIESSEILRKAGKAAGATAGSAPAVAKVKSQNKKKK